jgi:hypothetical protein
MDFDHLEIFLEAARVDKSAATVKQLVAVINV